MKTTVEIDDDLLVRAKKRAVELRVPLRSLIQDGLRAKLSRAAGMEGGVRARKQARKVEWKTVKGGLPEGLHMENRESMHGWIRS